VVKALTFGPEVRGSHPSHAIILLSRNLGQVPSCLLTLSPQSSQLHETGIFPTGSI